MHVRPASLMLTLLSCLSVLAAGVGGNGQELAEAPLFDPVASSKSDAAGEASVLSDREGPTLAAPDRRESGEEPPAPAEILLPRLRSAHPWARFEVGAWRRSQTVSEAFDGNGAFAGRSLTERTDRLVAVDEDSYTLATETVVSLAGLRNPEPTETQRFRLLTDRPYELGEPTVERGEAATVSLGGLAVPCRQWKVGYPGDGRGEEDLLYLAEEASPLLLRKERLAVVDGQPGTRSANSVTRLKTPGLFGQTILPVWHMAGTVTQPDGSGSDSFSVHSEDVPGGLLSETVTEFDTTGERLRWAVTTITSAGTTEDELASQTDAEANPAVSIEIRPRRFLRMLRREERRTPGP